MNYLLVGGHNDGKSVFLDKLRPYVECSIPPKDNLVRHNEDIHPFHQPYFVIEQYVPESIMVNEERLFFYRSTSLTTLQSIKALIQGYKCSTKDK